jgi:hypothetical protein
LVFGWDRKNGVPLQSLYDFARVFVPAGQSVSVTLNATALDFTQVLALAWRHALLLLLLLFMACRRCCWCCWCWLVLLVLALLLLLLLLLLLIISSGV